MAESNVVDFEFSSQANTAYQNNDAYTNSLDEEFIHQSYNSKDRSISATFQKELTNPIPTKSYYNEKLFFSWSSTFYCANFLADATISYKSYTSISSTTCKNTGNVGEIVNFELESSDCLFVCMFKLCRWSKWKSHFFLNLFTQIKKLKVTHHHLQLRRWISK